MLRLTLRNIADRPIRFLLTTAAVVLGVMFVVGTFITTENLRDRFDQLSLDIVGPEPDLAVRTSLATGDDESFGPRLPLPAAALDVVREVPGVAEVSGRLATFSVTPVTRQGEAVDPSPAPALGYNYNDSSLGTLFIQEGGRAPEYRGSIYQPDYVGEFVVDVDVADEYGFEVGQAYTVVSEVGSRRFDLVGLVTFGDPDEHKTAGGTFTAFDDQTAQEFYDRIGSYDYAVVRLEAGADPATVIDAITVATAAGRDQIVGQFVQDVLDGPEALLDELAAGNGFSLDDLAAVRIEALTAAELADELQGQFGTVVNIMQTVLLAFAVIGVLVSAFIINNTFNIILGQRIRELALLRAIGASGQQIRNAVLIEAIAVGVVSTALGLILGIGLAWGLRSALVALDFGDLPNRYPISLTTLAIAVGLGMGITLLASIAPARRAQRVAPMAALRDDLRLPPSSLSRRVTFGTVITVIGLIALGLSVVLDIRLLWLIASIATGALALFVGVYLLSPLLAPLAARLLGTRVSGVLVIGVGILLTLAGAVSVVAVIVFAVTRTQPIFVVGLPIAMGFGALGVIVISTGLAPFRLSGRVARENAAGNPRRTASAAAALTIGLALVSTAAVIAESVKATFVAALDDSVAADFFVFTSTFNPAASIPAEAVSEVRSLTEGSDPTLESVVSYRFALDGMAVAGDAKDVLGADLGLLVDHIDPQIISGDLVEAGPQSILVHRDPAADLELSVGDTVVATFIGGQEVPLEVAAVYADSTILGNWTIDISLFDRYLSIVADGFMTANVADGVPPEQARAEIEGELIAFPALSVQDRDEFRESQEQQVAILLAVIIVFVGLSLAIAVLGIAITMALTVFERTHELGLLRAVGMTRDQARRMISWEAVIIALFGGVLGVLLGTGFGVAVAVVLPETFIDHIAIPIPVLAGSLVASAVFGVVAALFPAYRAGRLEILEAISHH